MPSSIAAAISAAITGWQAWAASNAVMAFVIRTGVLFAVSAILSNRRDDPAPIPDHTRTETFASGNARWIVGRAKIGGIIFFWGEDWDVKGTERNNPRGGADDLHLAIGLSEGNCDEIEAVWVGNDRFNVKFDENGDPIRREQDKLDPNDINYDAKLALLPYELDPEVNAYFDVVRDQWRESESLESRVLDENDDDDAEIIRKAGLSGAISIIPYLDGDSTGERWQSLRRYTDDLDNRYLRVDNDLNNAQKALPFADEWTVEHRLQGIAGVHVRLRQWVKHNFDHRVFKSGTPNISFLVRGIRITYPDPTRTSGTVTQWTDNAAAIRYWWHTQRRGFPETAIDRDSFVSAFNACEQSIIPERPTEWPGGADPPEWSKNDDIWGFKKYSINGILDAGDSPVQIERDFDRQWQGQVVEDGGELFYYPGIDRPVTDNINGDDVIEYPEISAAPAMNDRINAVTLSMRQSSYHDYNTHALGEIVDVEKRQEVDQDYHLPTDLGQWRWTINPAQAYSLALINLRRARFATTIKLKLTPGSADDQVKYIKMSPGLVYSINIPEEGISGRRMILNEKIINPDFTVDATFIDSPIGIHESSYRLPELIPPPAFTPGRQGALPPKPTGLSVTSTARSSNDGSSHFSIVASVDDHPLRKVFRLKAGDNVWEANTDQPTYTFDVNVPLQIMEVTVRHIDKTGAVSLPIKEIFTPNYSALVLPTPRWKDAFFHSGTLQMAFEADEYVAGISGVEIRYTRKDLDDTTDLDVLFDNTWTINGELLVAKPVQIVQGQEISVDGVIRRSGHYNLFARFVSNISGTVPIRGPISAAREIAIDIQEDPVELYEAAPLWDVAYHNLYKWRSKYGNTKGENLMFPSFDPADDRITPTAVSGSFWTLAKADWDRINYLGSKYASTIKIRNTGGYTGISNNSTYYARKTSAGSVYQIQLYNTEQNALSGGSTGRRNISGAGTIANVEFEVDLDSVPFDVWNGYVDTSTVPANPGARWPFGRAPGYDQDFDTDNRNASTGLLRTNRGGNSTWFVTPPIQLGSSRRVEVRGEAYPFAPGTDAISNITFGGITIRGQRYKRNTTMPNVTLPEAINGTGTVTYNVTGLPTGLAFDPATRIISGRPTTNSTGQGTYTATDQLGGSVNLDFNWVVNDTLTRPSTPTNLRLQANGKGVTFLNIEWDDDANANYFVIDYLPVGGNLQRRSPIFTNQYEITELTGATTYRFRVTAFNGAGFSASTTYQQQTTLSPAVIPTTPSNIRLHSASDDALSLIWGSVSGAQSYELRYKEVSESNYPADNLVAGYRSTIGQIDNLESNTTYNVQVRGRSTAGASSWSTAGTFATLQISTDKPTVTITDHASGPNETRPFFEIVTSTLPNETGTDIEVTLLRPPEDGGNAQLPTDYYTYNVNNSLTTRTFRYFQGVGPGGTYFIRVRKDLTPRSGIGVSRYSAYYEETRTFTSVPRQPITPKNVDNPTKATEIQFRITRTGTATRYRVRYWKESDPATPLQFTVNDSGIGNTSFIYTLSGLDDEETYVYTLEAWNSHGWSIPSPQGSTTLSKDYKTPVALTNLRSAAVSDDTIILAWNNDERAESYQIEVDNSNHTNYFNGIVANPFNAGGLVPGTVATARIRGYQSRTPSGVSKYGPWRNFTQITMPSTSTIERPYPIGLTPITCARNSTEPRKIDWTFVCPRHEGVIGLQVRYRQSTAAANDGKVPDWVIAYENIFTHTFSADNETFSGTFDPKFSSRYWEIEARVLVGTQAGLDYDAGFSNWGKITNSESHPTNSTTISNVFQNGAKPMTAPVPTVYQVTNDGAGSYHGDIQMVVDWIPNVDDWESPDDDSGSSRNEIRIKYNNRVREIWGEDYPTDAVNDYKIAITNAGNESHFWTQGNTLSWLRIRRFIGIKPYHEFWKLAAGMVFKVQIVRYETGRPTAMSNEVTYTVTETSDVDDYDPKAVIFGSPTFNGRDVKINWSAVQGVDRYEVTLIEDNVGASGTSEVLVQTGAPTSWTKEGGINEHFAVRVRSIRRVYGRDYYSQPRTYTYAPQEEVGKITGLRAEVSGANLILRWNDIPGDIRYEREFTDDDGETWTTPHIIPTSDHTPTGSVTHTMTNYAHADTMLRLRAFKYDTNGTTKIYSTSYTSFHWYPTPTGNEAPNNGEINPINSLAAVARNGNILLDWVPPEHDDNHPEATRYRIQHQQTNGSWVNFQSGIAGSVSQWPMTGFSPGTEYNFRVRPETFTQDGEWTDIIYTPDTAVSVGTASANAAATYTTVTASWLPVENAQEYELEYHEGTGSFGGAGGQAHTDVHIEDITETTYQISSLEANEQYQLRVRGIAGGSAGPWSDVVNVNTLESVELPAPTGLTLSTTGNTLRISWNAVTNATGYHLRIDAKLTTDATYSQYRDRVVRNYASTITAVDINRLELGSALLNQNLDLQVRIKANFFDSPTAIYSPYQSIRWNQGQNIAAPGGGGVVIDPGNTQQVNSVTNPHIMSGVNGIVNIAAYPRSNENYKVMYIQYTVAVTGTYTFRAQYLAANGGVDTANQIQLARGTLPSFATGTTDTNGVSIVTAQLSPGTVIVKHYLGSNVTETPSTFTMQVSGPSVATVPLQLVLSASTVNIREGSNADVNVKLNKSPGSDLAITFTSNNSDITFSNGQTTLTRTFTTTNWDTNYSLRINAAEDVDANSETGTISISGTGITGSILCQLLDNDRPLIVVDDTDLTIQEGSSQTVNIKLATIPTGNVTLTISESSGLVTLSRTSMTFTTTNWDNNQTLTITPVTDSDVNDAQTQVLVAASGGGYDSLAASIGVKIDDTTIIHTLDLTPTTMSLTEGGSTGTIRCRIGEAITSNITIHLANSNLGAVSINKEQLVFTPLNARTYQTVIVTPNQDSDHQNEVATISFTNSALGINSSVVVNVSDNDTAAIFLNPSSVTMAALSSSTVGIALRTRPSANVTISTTSNSNNTGGISWSPTSLTFTRDNWKQAQNLTITSTTNVSSATTRTIPVNASGGGYNNINASISLRVNPVVAEFATPKTSINNVSTPANLFATSSTSTTPARGTGTKVEIPRGYGTRSNTILGVQDQYHLLFGVLETGSHTWKFETSGTMRLYRIRREYVFDNGSTSSHISITLSPVTPTSYTLTVNLDQNRSPNRDLYYLITVTCLFDPSYSSSARLSCTYTSPTGSSGTQEESTEGLVQGAIAAGTNQGTAERVNISSETYSHVEQPPLNSAVLPTFFGEFDTQCWVTGEAIDDYQIPHAGNGLPPYTITANNLPAGITFDESTRTISGTPTQTGPLGGIAEFILRDANGHTESRYMEWVIAVPTPATWNDFNGGIGQITNPFVMACATKGNIRGPYYIPGGTNAEAIINNDLNERSRVIWFRCPTSRPHVARLIGAKGADYDYDLVVKVGDDFYFSDTDDNVEFIKVPGHSEGALIGIYRYEETTTWNSYNNTGDPLILEWYPEIEHLPKEEAGAQAFSASASQERGANANADTPGSSDTDIYVLHRNNPNSAWARRAVPISGWTFVGTDATEIRFEVHLKKWENRALRRFTTFHRDV